MSTEKTFEEMIKNLEEISQDLENGDLSLDKSMEKFEEGMKLSKKCSEILENAEKKIKILIKDGEDFKEEDFNAEWKSNSEEYKICFLQILKGMYKWKIIL